jgi:SAM-dependent methyltransferase
MANIFRYIYNSVFINNSEDNIFFRQLLIISFIAILYYVYKEYVDDHDMLYEKEGFSQDESYIYKRNNESFDSFYIEIFDMIYNNSHNFPLEIEHIIKTTNPDKNSNILDLCSNTGLFVNEFKKYNYNIYGLENINDMITYSNKNYPDARIIKGTIDNPMTFNNNTFTHIVCNNFNFYRYKNKEKVFSQCNYWLKPNGYFILHLVNPHKFDTIMPIAKPSLYKNIQKWNEDRIKKCEVDFLGFKYKSEYNFEDNNTLTLKEKFIDKESNNIREQEREYYMDSLKNIETLALKNNFHLHSKAKMSKINNDDYQYIYIFEKIH